MHQITPNDPTRTNVTHICVTSLHEYQILLRFTVRRAILSYRQFCEKCTKWPKMTLNTTSSNVPHVCYLCPWFLNFTPFCYTVSPFWDIGHFDTRAPNDPQITSNPTRSNVPDICITTLGSQISLYDQPFLKYKPFWDKCTEWPQIDLEPYQVKLPYICINGVPDSQILLRSLHDQSFSRCGPFWDMCTEWPQIDIEPYKVKSPYICITSVPDSQISLRFAERPTIFEILAILRKVHWMTPKWPWTYKVKGISYMCYWCPLVPYFMN